MKNRYGQLPQVVDYIEIASKEMLFYQDMLLKLPGETECAIEKRLMQYHEIIASAINNFIENFGISAYRNHHVYISAKNLFQKKGSSFNRMGWHCDGFMSNDVTYIWSDKNPTVFNFSEFKLSQDHSLSMREMQEQADEKNNMCYDNFTLVRINQYNVHKVADVLEDGLRTFIKISFSLDKFDLKGNAINYDLDYKWDFKPRATERNTPQSMVSSSNFILNKCTDETS